ncbi:MAG: putative MPP superfamily phosphohydrolase [Saprospiraceae bacterium]|jgi:predicted MPP superfamily phosphohydrolase
MSARQIFYVVFTFASFFVFAYPLGRLSHWLTMGSGLGWSYTGLIWAIATVAMWYSFKGPKMFVRYIMVHWMGASFVFMSLTVVAELPILIWPYTAQLSAVAVISIGLMLVIGALIASHFFKVKTVTLRSKKLTKPIRLAQLSDVHIGSRQAGFMQRAVDKLNAQNPNIAVITGDLVDSSAVNSVDLQSLKNIKAPTYFVIGNHERYADLDKILGIMQDFGITTLRQQAKVIDELQLVGVDDADRRDQVEQMMPSITLKPNLFNVLLYHRPVGWAAARRHDMDLMLSGHTHNGQIFPFNFIVKQQFDRIAGLYTNENKWLYVNSGTGTWGPLMRLGTANEITVLDLLPE